jgi:cyclic pyranopterin phosphate synthase
VKEKIQAISPLVDQFSRTISYLRLSLTDRCNLRCIYCMPDENQDSTSHIKTGKFLPHSELLSYEELLRIVRLAVSLGMDKIRLTGGEPLVRKGVIDFIKALGEIDGLKQIRLTTNGVLLAEYAEHLFASGVCHINVSLDTLQPEKFKKITGRDKFALVWEGLTIAASMGFTIKINVVAMRGVNDDEFLDFARLAMNYPFQVRFIEFMPVGEKDSWHKEQFIRADSIRRDIATLGTLTPFQRPYGKGPARMFELCGEGGKGEVGFISPISHHFCDQCNRLRLTSEGRLRACLLKDYETDLKHLLRGGATDQEIVASIRQTVLDKPQGHTMRNEIDAQERARCGGDMSRIGG